MMKCGRPKKVSSSQSPRGSKGIVCKYNFGDLNMKQLLTILLVFFSSTVTAEWIEYSTKSNGDVFLFDSERVEKNGNEITIWTRVRFKTSIMAASSYQSLIKIDCSENSVIEVQSTFYTDRDWIKPAMATNTNEKPKTAIKQNSETQQLADILCTE